MKKNLISVLILALLVVNLVLTSIMMFSTMSSVKKTSALVTSIASVLNIELGGESEVAGETEIKLSDLEPHDIPDDLTIPLKKGEDGKDHYCIVAVSLMLNKTHPDYETYGANIASQDSLIKSIIIEVIGSHTIEEVKADSEALRNEILAKLQEAYDSDFIYKVAFSNIMYQ